MPTDAQNSKRRITALKDAFAKYYQDTNTVPDVILMTRPFYKLLENEKMNTVGLLFAAEVYRVTKRCYRGSDVYLAEDFEIASDFCFMAKEEFSYFKKRQVMFYRLMTNGEMQAQGKGKHGRVNALFYEAEGFADMCAGYDRWEEMLQDYLKTYPEPPVE